MANEHWSEGTGLVLGGTGKTGRRFAVYVARTAATGIWGGSHA